MIYITFIIQHLGKDELIPQPYLSFLINYLCGVFAVVQSPAVEGLFDCICNYCSINCISVEELVLGFHKKYGKQGGRRCGRF